jgi:hypothetical protein
VSYNFKILVEGGRPVVAETSGTIPDGAYHVSGHQEPSQRSIAVVATRPDGSLEIQASSAASSVSVAV